MTDHTPHRYRDIIAEETVLSSPEPALTLNGVSVRRGNLAVLRDIDLTIPAGSVTVVVGRSGAGKSTLIRALNGLTPVGGGTIRAGGIGSLDTAAAMRAHQRQTATIFQDHALIDRLPAIDNVLLGLADLRHPLSPLPWPDTLRERAAHALDEVGLLAHAWRRTGHLSGGERQRVGVARALVRRPKLLLADEPFASVDPSLMRHLSQDLRRTALASGLTLVVVLHQIETALAMADRIVGLADGRVAFTCHPDQFDTAAQARLFQPYRPEEIGLD